MSSYVDTSHYPVSVVPKPSAKPKVFNPGASGFLTPQQFAQTAAAKKNPSYADYVSWTTKTRRARAAAHTAAAATKTGAAATDPFTSFLTRFQSTMLTPAQQIAQAKAYANTSIAAQLAGIRASTAAAQAQMDAQAKRGQGYATALANLTVTNPATIAQEYRDTADRERAYGTGLTGALGQSYQQAADTAAQHLQGVTGAPSTVLNPEALRNTLQYTGVVMPGRNLEEQAAAGMASAAFNRAANVSKVGEIAQEYLKKKTDLQSDLATKVATIRATQPDLYMKMLSSLQSEGRQDMATILQGLALRGTNDLKAAQAGLATAKTGATKTGVTQKWAGLTGVDPRSGDLLPGFYYRNAADEKAHKASLVPKTQHVDPTNPYKLVPNTPSKGPAKPKPGTVIKTVQQTINSVRKTVVDAAKSDAYSTAVNPLLPTLGRSPSKNWAEAVKGLQQYFPKKYRNDPRVLQLIYDQLTANGYKKPSGIKPKPQPPGQAGPDIPKGWTWDPTKKQWVAP